MDGDAFPELDIERSRLAFSRACRDSMIERFSRVDSGTAADKITKEYVEMTVWDALHDLRTPGAGDFFGRIDEDGGDCWYVGRRHIETDEHDPVVVDWRAPIAAPFYRATVADPFGLRFRRRFTLTDGELVAYFDEHLDDPTAADVATGIPDPVLAEIGAARTGAMKEIVATIQAEQDEIIRSPLEGCLIVQGGPGTGKTAVGLHRAAYLMFEHRRRLVRDGVLVVGPNRVFLDYIANVLPSLGERAVRQCTAADLCVPRVEIDAVDPPDVAVVKGGEAIIAELARTIADGIRPPAEDVRVPLGSRTVVFSAEEIAGWIADVFAAGPGVGHPFNKRRDALRAIGQRELQRRTQKDDLWSKAGVLKDALNAAWPTMQPRAAVTATLRRLGLARTGTTRWSLADQFLLDEANSMLNGPPFVYGHVVIDEAQDQSAVALRAIGRRSRTGSITLLGDLAQSTTPAGQEDWGTVGRLLGVSDATVRHLTVGYRVPGPILEIANKLLPFTGVIASASTSARTDGEPPKQVVVAPDEVVGAVAAAVVDSRHHHLLTGVVAPEHLHEAIGVALSGHGLTAVSHVHGLGSGEVPVFGAEAVKGLEFDGVVVVNPHEIFDGSARGARLLYVALSRAVQTLTVVTDRASELL